MVMPSSQWFGSGLGHSGSTSNFGACSPEACTAASFSRTEETTPRTTRIAENAATAENPRLESFIRFLLHGKWPLKNVSARGYRLIPTTVLHPPDWPSD